MKSKTIRLVFFLFAILICEASPALRAQSEAPAPLILNFSGDLWRWTKPGVKPEQLTKSGFISQPVVSPEGTRLAYVSASDLAAKVLQREPKAQFARWQTDLWVMDAAAGQSTRIADQSADASFGVNAVPDQGIMRARPAWSPDGMLLAWGELLLPDLTDQLVIYDLAAGKIKATIILPHKVTHPRQRPFV